MKQWERNLSLLQKFLPCHPERAIEGIYLSKEKARQLKLHDTFVRKAEPLIIEAIRHRKIIPVIPDNYRLEVDDWYITRLMYSKKGEYWSYSRMVRGQCSHGPNLAVWIHPVLTIVVDGIMHFAASFPLVIYFFKHEEIEELLRVLAIEALVTRLEERHD